MRKLNVPVVISVIFAIFGVSSNVMAYRFTTTSCEDFPGYEICVTKISKDKISKIYEGVFHYEFSGSPVFDGSQTDWDEVYFNFKINCSKNTFKITNIFVQGQNNDLKKLPPKLRTRLIKDQTNAYAKPLKKDFCPLALWPKVHV